MRIGMRHQLVRLLGGAVEAERMIDVVRRSERNAGIGAVDRRRRRIEQMLAAGMAAAFEHIEEAHEVAVGVGMGIDQRMPHTGLGGEMHDPWKTMGRKQLLHRLAVGEFDLLETEIGMAGQLAKPRLLQTRIVVSVEIVGSDNGRAVGEQALRHMHSDKSRSARNQDRIRQTSVLPCNPKRPMAGRLDFAAPLDAGF